MTMMADVHVVTLLVCQQGQVLLESRKLEQCRISDL